MPETEDAVLPLQEWLKLLVANGVPMRSAMIFAAKAYKDHNTQNKLASMTPGEIAGIVQDKELRKTYGNAVKALQSGKKRTKRSRDDDLLVPLEPNKPKLPTSFEFNEILDPQQLIPVTVTVNRAPVKTAWAYTVARRLGFDVQEALSLAHVYVHIGSLKHALALGNILDPAQTKDAEEEIRELPGEHDYRRPPEKERDWRKRNVKVEKAVGSSQPWVGLLKTKPVIERPDGTWRALQKGVPVEPSQAYLYITRALKACTSHVMGAMKLVAESYEPEELNVLGVSLYSEFKPDVTEWGQRGTVSVAAILDQLKAPLQDRPEEPPAAEENGDVDEFVEVEASSAADPTQAQSEDTAHPENGDSAGGFCEDEPPAKRPRTMTLEEYEAMLDDEDDFDAELLNIPGV